MRSGQQATVPASFSRQFLLSRDYQAGGDEQGAGNQGILPVRTSPTMTKERIKAPEAEHDGVS